MKGNINPGIDFSDANRYVNLGIDWFCCRYSENDYLDSTEELNHKRFSEKLGTSWKYHISKRPLQYIHNEIGFREKPLNTFDIANSFAIFGCSHIYGTGNYYNDTVSQFLKQYLGHDCLNFGVGGASTTTVYNNLLKFLSVNDTCKGIAVVWPNVNRLTSIWRYAGDEVHQRWRRHDVVPGTNKLNYWYLDKEFKRKPEDVHPSMPRSHHVDNPHNIYLINSYRLAIQMICKERNIPLAEMFIDDIFDSYPWPNCDINVPRRTEQNLTQWSMGGYWHEVPERDRWWFVNNMYARDISRMDTNEIHRLLAHRGCAVNRGIAKSLSNIFNEVS